MLLDKVRSVKSEQKAANAMLMFTNRSHLSSLAADKKL